MSLRNLPEAKTFRRPQNFQWDAPSDVLASWVDAPRAAESAAENVISIFDVIGEDWWTGGGFTAKRAAAALRSIGERDIVVQINSPGGDMFEGIAIYNLLRAHKGKVTVQVLGWAASAASIIAMAGDDIVMGLGSFMMVHNAWGMVVGNRHDLAEASTLFEGFDSAIADIYEARTGSDRKAIVKLMDAETFMGASDAVASKFADRVDEGLKLDASAQNRADDEQIRAKRRLDALMAKDGIPRSERRKMFAEIKGGKQDATPSTMRAAGADIAVAKQLTNLFKL